MSAPHDSATHSPAAQRNARNERAWSNPGNWKGPRWLGVYNAADDSRLFVRKFPRMLGYTLNFGHPLARWLVIGLFALLIIGSAGLLWLER